MKKLLLKISQYSRETPVLESLFNKAGQITFTCLKSTIETCEIYVNMLKGVKYVQR